MSSIEKAIERLAEARSAKADKPAANTIERGFKSATADAASPAKEAAIQNENMAGEDSTNPYAAPFVQSDVGPDSTSTASDTETELATSSSIEEKANNQPSVEDDSNKPIVSETSPETIETVSDTQEEKAVAVKNEAAPKTESLEIAQTDAESANELASSAGVETPSERTKIASNSISLNREVELDFTMLESNGYLTPQTENQQLAEEYRHIKRPLLMNAFGKGAALIDRGNVISITSSLPGEGKTYTSINLAVSIASELDSTILVVDGDVIRSSLSKLLGVEERKGLIDLLENPKLSVMDVICNTQVPKLKIIPAGSKSINSTELLASDQMERLVDELSRRYKDRIVMFDSSPLLATSDASIINHLAGQIVVVVEAGATPTGAVNDALSKIKREKVTGLLLNKSRESSRWRYGKGGYYGGYY